MNLPAAEKEKIHLSLPLHIHHVAYLMKDPPHDSPHAREEFRQLLSFFQIGSDRIFEDKRMGTGIKEYPNGDRLLIYWRLHTEYYSYQTWHLPAGPGRLPVFGPIDLPGYLFQACPLGTRIAWLDLVFQHRSQPIGQDELKKYFKGTEIYGSRISNGTVSVYTDFTPDSESRVRFLVYSSDGEYLAERAFFIAESLSFLENYYHLILMPLEEFNQNMNETYLLEKDQVIKREEISGGIETSGPKQLKEWLIVLTRSLAEANRIGDRVRYNLASAVPYDSILKATLADLNEVPVEYGMPMSHFISRKVRGIADGYQRLIDRIDALNKALEGTIAVLRTRVDMAMEEQNLALLKSVDQTTKNQVHLQQTVEGLSVIVLSYYITGIVNYFFKGLSEWGYIHSPYLATALFLPLSILTAFGLVYRVKKTLNQNKDKTKKG